MSDTCPCAGLDKLKELTESLPSFPPLVKAEDLKGYSSVIRLNGIPTVRDIPVDTASNGYLEYKMDTGECFSWFIHRSGNDIAVHRWFITKGTIFPKHVHPEKEWLIVYTGAMDLFLENGDMIELRKGDSYYVLPNMVHWSTYPEDCKFITITIPPAKEFPHV